MNFDYNSTRKKLILSEYGRNVQNMVAFICSLPTKDERNKHAQVVIDLMGFLNPHLRDVADFKHKLWDHLHIISDFKIDVDSPYPQPNKETLHLKPDALGYPNQKIRYKHYGKTVELMIQKAKAIPESDRKQQIVQAIANFMKISYITWNKDTVADETILNDLKELSRGELSIDENFSLSKVDIRTNAPGIKQKTGDRIGNNNNNKNLRNNNRSNQGSNNRNKTGGKRY